MSTRVRHSSQNLLNTTRNQALTSQPACKNPHSLHWNKQTKKQNKAKQTKIHRVSKKGEREHVMGLRYTTKITWSYAVCTWSWPIFDIKQFLTGWCLEGRPLKNTRCCRLMPKLILYCTYHTAESEAEEKTYFALSAFLGWWTGKKKKKERELHPQEQQVHLMQSAGLWSGKIWPTPHSTENREYSTNQPSWLTFRCLKSDDVIFIGEWRRVLRKVRIQVLLNHTVNLKIQTLWKSSLEYLKITTPKNLFGIEELFSY